MSFSIQPFFLLVWILFFAIVFFRRKEFSKNVFLFLVVFFCILFLRPWVTITNESLWHPEKIIINTEKAMQYVNHSAIEKAIEEIKQYYGNLPVEKKGQNQSNAIFLTHQADLRVLNHAIRLPFSTKPEGIFDGEVPEICYEKQPCELVARGFIPKTNTITLFLQKKKVKQKKINGHFEIRFTLKNIKAGLYSGSFQIQNSDKNLLVNKLGFLLSVEKGLPVGKVLYSKYTPFVFVMLRNLSINPLAKISQISKEPDYYIVADEYAWQKQKLEILRRKKPSLVFTKQKIHQTKIQTAKPIVIQNWFETNEELNEILTYFIRKQSSKKNPVKGSLYSKGERIKKKKKPEQIHFTNKQVPALRELSKHEWEVFLAQSGVLSWQWNHKTMHLFVNEAHKKRSAFLSATHQEKISTFSITQAITKIKEKSKQEAEKIYILSLPFMDSR
ncbi:MAG: hypothetical protein D6767_09740, partial [Candidatus Hydrogenedentota bacterium]